MQFPPRTVPDAWPSTSATLEEILDRIDRAPLRAADKSAQNHRRYGARSLLRWLGTFPGATWQQRWQASRATSWGTQWLTAPAVWLAEQGEKPRPAEFKSGLLCLLLADVIRPDLAFLLEAAARSRHWRQAVGEHRDPAGFARLAEESRLAGSSSMQENLAFTRIALMVLAKGGGVSDITVGDCLELRTVEPVTKGGSSKIVFYSLLKGIGTFPADAPATLRLFTVLTGQLTVEQLVDRYGLKCWPVRDLLVDYLAERQPALDYNSLEGVARTLTLHFWANLETHHSGIESLHLSKDVAVAWKQRLRTKVTRRRQPDGSIGEVSSPRDNYGEILAVVRGFYLDIAHWAAEDPVRWGPWAAPTPVNSDEANHRKHASRRKAKMDQRTRERLPAMPALVRAAEQHLRDAQARLHALQQVPAGSSFTVLGDNFTKTNSNNVNHPDRSYYVRDADGRRRNLWLDEQRAFWGWAAVEFLRHTGVRIEEMLKTSHHSITQYRVPANGELIPLLQIAPSKNDRERLLVVAPELADVLSAIIHRVRGDSGAVPLVPFYDVAERIWLPPAPLLFQWRLGGERRVVSDQLIRKSITEILTGSAIIDVTGQPLHYQPHDFRRIFTTEATMNGMPPHIAQLLLGHQDINTTMGYKAVYPEEAINGHRAFIARRRALRPGGEYRVPTEEEWTEFLGHFEQRKVALGDCGRAYGTSCQHEHSCVRCPVLRVDQTQRPRLIEIRDNLTGRIDEAEREGWLGEAEGLRVSLAAAQDKLAQLDDRSRRSTTVTLGLPAFADIAGRTASPSAGPRVRPPGASAS
ncbi:site-specific integrase [Umezawaea sp. Da 62-37]|uniref:site-specific integrase n=1 Tax=Umezawaea sp. Da 62-37 TaxID=3075927 RepID=UPI0028F74F7C|nr:site-specific integrase [Umezawaea sp. Da 62-37]WNV84919.1 site-specific integrase [Umezawaea sp. Da 62-37]